MPHVNAGHFFLGTEGIAVVRGWLSGDEAALVRHANNRKLWRNMRDRFPHPYTMDDAVWWVQVASTTQPPTDFAIEVDGEAVGCVVSQLVMSNTPK